jgi:hypothetical protein
MLNVRVIVGAVDDDFMNVGNGIFIGNYAHKPTSFIFISRPDAIAAEKRIKGWTRAKKVALIRTINPTFKNLARS